MRQPSLYRTAKGVPTLVLTESSGWCLALQSRGINLYECRCESHLTVTRRSKLGEADGGGLIVGHVGKYLTTRLRLDE